jgi:hypothetical protein
MVISSTRMSAIRATAYSNAADGRSEQAQDQRQHGHEPKVDQDNLQLPGGGQETKTSEQRAAGSWQGERRERRTKVRQFERTGTGGRWRLAAD